MDSSAETNKNGGRDAVEWSIDETFQTRQLSQHFLSEGQPLESHSIVSRNYQTEVRKFLFSEVKRTPVPTQNEIPHNIFVTFYKHTKSVVLLSLN